MSGSVAGGKKAALKNLENDPNFYSRIGRIGGSNGHGNKGFATNPELASSAGRLGGSISRRRKMTDAIRADNLIKTI